MSLLPRKNRKTIPVNCLHCGKEFMVAGWQLRQGVGRYCSRPCMHKGTSDLKTGRPPLPRDRIWEYCDQSGGPDSCWNWLKYVAKDGDGYAKLGIEYAHRVAWEVSAGQRPPDELMVCHTCDNPKCINPKHLFLGTHQDNMDDMWAKGRGNPPKGEDHPMAKITEAEVIQMKQMKASGAKPKKIAEVYHLSVNYVHQILRGERWKHLNT